MLSRAMQIVSRETTAKRPQFVTRRLATSPEILRGLNKSIDIVARNTIPEDDIQDKLLKANFPLVKQLVKTSVERSLADHPNNFIEMVRVAMQNNPGNPDAAAMEVLKNMMEHPLEFMDTIHPTWVLLQKVIKQIFVMQETAIKFRNSPDVTAKNIVVRLLPKISGPLTQILLSSIVMDKKMTLEDELRRVAEYEVDAAEQVPSVIRNLLEIVQKEIYGNATMPDSIRNSLVDFITDMLSKQGLWFDLDGRKTTPDMVARVTQIAQEVRTERLIEHAKKLLEGNYLQSQEDKNIVQSALHYWRIVENNRKTEGGMGAYFSLDTAKAAEERTLKGGINNQGEWKKGLNPLLNSNGLSPEAKNIIEKMIGIVRRGYARKGPIDTRRDSSVYNKYVEDVYSLLQKFMKEGAIINDPSSPESLHKSFEQMRTLLSENPTYMGMDESQHVQFQKLLRAHGTFFGGIMKHFPSLPVDTRDGIKIMAEQVSNGDNIQIFSGEIISETGTHGSAYGDVHRLWLLQDVASAVAGIFRTGQSGKARSIKPLIEEKNGLLGAGEFVRDLLKDANFRKAIAEKGVFATVVSMSDNMRESGPFAKIFVAISINAMESALKEAQELALKAARSEKDPEAKAALMKEAELFAAVKFKALIGGGDGERNAVLYDVCDVHSTMQGADIQIKVAEPGALWKTFSSIVGQETGMYKMRKEIKALEERNPLQYNLLIKVANLCTDAHKKFFESHNFRKACATILGPEGAALLSLANPGSRLAAKKDSEVTGKKPDVARVRAIAGDTAKYITGLAHPARSFSSVLGLSDKEKNQLPDLGELSIFDKMTHYDVYSQIAYSDYPRAEAKLSGATDEERGAVSQSKQEVIQAMYGASYFLKPEVGLRIRNYLDNNKDLPPHELSFGAMEASGDPVLQKVADVTRKRKDESVIPARHCLDGGKVREATFYLRATDVFRPLLIGVTPGTGLKHMPYLR